MATNKNAKESYTLWQDSKDNLPEQALVIECFMDIVCITQTDAHININYKTIPELIKILKTLKEPK
jgi:hypothetical protein